MSLPFYREIPFLKKNNFPSENFKKKDKDFNFLSLFNEIQLNIYTLVKERLDSIGFSKINFIQKNSYTVNKNKQRGLIYCFFNFDSDYKIDKDMLK